MATILVVDDQPSVRQYLLTLLRAGEHRLLEAGNGEAALSVAKTDRPDLIISDVLMPAMDGYEFVRRLRRDPEVAKTPVIFHTAACYDHDARALAEACGVRTVVEKPASPETVLSAVRRALGVPPVPASAIGTETFTEDHRRLLTNKLVERMGELESVAERLKNTNETLAREVERRARAESEARESAVLLRGLSRRLIGAQENERRAIARELHDEIGQALSTLKLNLHLLERGGRAGERAVWVADSIGLVERTLRQVRDLSLDLRPSVLDDLGLVPALEWQLNRLADRAGFRARLRTAGVSDRLPPELETACFRVVQEALTNVVRHSHARAVAVGVRRTGRRLLVTVRDDGVGFDVPAATARGRAGGSLGLLGMKERVLFGGGDLRLRSSPGRGTTVRARFPLSAPPAGGDDTTGGAR